jgi:hypothetical protein
MLTGRSIVSNMLGGTPLTKCTLAAVLYSPRGTETVLEYEFGKHQYSDTLEQPSSINRQTMEQGLDLLDKEIRGAGFEAQPRGNFWYSRRYRRPFDPHAPLPAPAPAQQQRMGKSFWRGKPVPVEKKKCR